MHLQPLLDNIRRYIELEPSEVAAFSAIVEHRTISRKEFLVQPGMVCKFQTYVLKGALRSYFISPSGEEHTIQFAIEDWFISDFNSYINQDAATLYVEALETSELLQIEYQKVEELCESHPRFERFFRKVAQKSFAYAQRRVLSSIGKSAEERFKEFHSMYPGIVERVPQYALASYLGMSPEFLSKIRKRLQNISES